MTDENLKQTMQREWQNVRKRFHYPQLPQPQLVEEGFSNSFNQESLELRISEEAINEINEYGVSPEKSLNNIFNHELIHFMKYPGSVLNVLRLQKAGQGITTPERISVLRQDFTEAQTRIEGLNGKHKHPNEAEMINVYFKRGGTSYGCGNLMYGLYQEVSGQDFGVNLNKQERTLVDKLRGINFLDKNQETKSFKRFAQTLKDYQPPQDKNQKKGKNQQGEGNGQGQGEGQGSQGNPCSGKGNSLESFTDNQIREGLKQFAQECSNPDEYEEIVKQVLGENKEKGTGQEHGQVQQAMGKRAGSGRGITQLAKNFYTALAEKYTIPVRKKPMHRNGSLYPHSHTSFEIGDSITEVDAFSTPGILPGITKKWVRKEGEVYNNEEAVPDSFIVIDNSGSMPSSIDGRERLNGINSPGKLVHGINFSLPVLGATAISNAYLINGSKVAVYNFGGDNYLLEPTKNRESVHEKLRIYTGGGTTFNPKFLEGILRESEMEYDISVISDMDIGNLNSFIETVLKIPRTHRVHLLCTDNEYVGQLRKSFGNKENVAILPLTSEYDIQQITMGELKKSVK